MAIGADVIQRADVSKWLVSTAFGLGLVSVLLAGADESGKWPPDFKESWTLIWAASILSISLALAASRRATGRTARISCGISIVFALLGGWLSIINYYDNFLDYPWPVLIPLVLLVSIGGWFCGQRLLASLVPVAFAYWFYGALTPPSAIPTKAVVGDVSCTLLSVSKRSTEFEIAGPIGTNLDNVCDLNRIEPNGRIGWAIPVRCWGVFGSFSQLILEQPTDSSRRRFRVTSFVPAWTQSWNLEIPVQRWPLRPSAKVTIPLSTSASAAYRSAGNGVSLEVDGMRWSKTEDDVPRPCLSLHVRYNDGADVNTGHEVRVEDDLGNPLPVDPPLVVTNGPGHEADLRLFPVNKRAKSIDVEVFSPDSLERARIVFRFARIRCNPPSFRTAK
ncbi:MAG: hypothetical protein ACHQ50_03290 [Fimbriimonadales bacterium]